MKRLWLILALAWMVGTGILTAEASAMALDEVPCWEVSPFLGGYTCSGKANQDLGEIYRLTFGNTQVLAYRTSPGSQPEDGIYTPGGLACLGAVSGRLRTVIAGGYPQVDVRQLEEQANAWLGSQGEPEVAALQPGEALLATQITLWKLLDPGAFPDGGQYAGWKDLSSSSWAGYRKRLQAPESLTQVPTEHTARNIQSLIRYLEALPPVEANGTLISDAALAEASYRASREEAGTWQVTVEVPGISCGEGGEMTLKASCNGQEKVLALEEEPSYRFNFSGLDSPQPVTLTLEGVQTAEDALLLSAGETLLIGWAQGTIPVCGQITLRPDRILHIQKNAAPEEGGLPLANIQFNLYLAATMEQLRRGEVRLTSEPTAQEAESCQRAENLVAILSTDVAGQASYNFTSGGNPDGVYLVVEQFCPGTTGPVDPFYITIPAEDGYILELSLENSLESQPEIALSVTQQGRYEDTFGIGQAQAWYIWAGIPAGMSAARSFTLIDPLPEVLDYMEDTLTVHLQTGSGDSLLLVPDIHYTMGMEAGELKISLTPAGMAYAAANRGEGTERPGILVTFQAVLGEDAPMGQSISHRARLSYVNGAGVSYSKESPWAQVRTGGFSICKRDPSGNPLAGNVYRLARVAGEEKETVLLNVDGIDVPVVYVSFLAGETMTEEAVTDKEGRAVFSGLAYGHYYLVETRGTGEAPVEIVVDEESHHWGDDSQKDRTVHLISTRVLLPDTGGMGAVVLTMLGLAAVLSACILLFENRKRGY